jgi:hypothetical protein
MISFINWLFCIDEPKQEVNENLTLYIKNGKFHVDEEPYNPANLLHVNSLNTYFINRKTQEQSKINAVLTPIDLKGRNYKFKI